MTVGGAVPVPGAPADAAGADTGAEADCGAPDGAQPESAATSVLIARAASAFGKM
ncbi:hypothetical protein [Yinghuangia seranimata]|uniref:hypothetical protein n=1 Tax=Yinghuangia seranimata TaxID=408067 RepID=UPI00248C6E7C|nr:hypothetical protein [Yinghuangia seranimata]MDI2129443.1 hypothetical protein [Yinghuangia seranimata]